MHLHRSFTVVALIVLAGSIACSSTPDPSGSSSPSPSDVHDAGTSPAPAGSSLGDAAAPIGDGGGTSCVAPDVLIALDRTMTMLRTPAGQLTDNTPSGRASTKFGMAISAIKAFTAPPRDTTMRFGLELWPKRDPGCETMATALNNIGTTNPSCQEPEIVVSPDLATSDLLGASLDPETTPLCFSTPTGTALAGAKAELDTHKAAGKSQYVVLITDGADWDLTCATPNPIQVVDQLAGDGISTVVVGFSAEASVVGGVGAGFLNDMACAGRTAVGFPASCTKTAAGTYRWTGSGQNVFFSAQDQTQLQSELDGLAKTVCCGCVH